MWTPHRFVGATAASPLVVARRYLHANKFSSTPPTTAANETGTSTVSASSPSSSSSAKDLQLDDTEEWALSQVQRSVESGRQTKEAADYFRSIMHEQPEFHQCLKEARRLIGGQDPERLTRYQQGQFADRLCTYMSGIASEKLRRIQAEEQSAKRYTQDGTPTGENYWFEAGNTLSSPAVPGFVKDEILCEMQQHRSAKSPAFERPPGEEEEDAHAVHLRRQRSKLFSDADFK
ncbi:hypothetical protein ABL78_7228 [Leptomonas seymouri]|uniref:Uncharacterized protein n=1 Tax=Leptomonas seymouri TaxID=5684 RepID=A0A0N1P9M1_LEPSE|nr:hypothetical protein ABL78_7228 [Leptomonas seymouri]|eukprot:KPI83725.1 hypothetical protein ABL78_7228 [Leptomonas seymouri]